MVFVDSKRPVLSATIHLLRLALLGAFAIVEMGVLRDVGTSASLAPLTIVVLTALLLIVHWSMLLRDLPSLRVQSPEQLARQVDQSFTCIYRYSAYTIRPRPSSQYLARRARGIFEQLDLPIAISAGEALRLFLRTPGVHGTLWALALGMVAFLWFRSFPSFAQVLEQVAVFRVVVLWIIGCFLANALALLAHSVLDSKTAEV